MSKGSRSCQSHAIDVCGPGTTTMRPIYPAFKSLERSVTPQGASLTTRLDEQAQALSSPRVRASRLSRHHRTFPSHRRWETARSYSRAVSDFRDISAVSVYTLGTHETRVVIQNVLLPEGPAQSLDIQYIDWPQVLLFLATACCISTRALFKIHRNDGAVVCSGSTS